MFKYFKNCSVCKYYLWGRKKSVCDNCWQGLFFFNSKKNLYLNDNMRVFSLYNYGTAEKNESLDRLIKSIKCGNNRDTIKRLAQELCFRNPIKGAIVVPIPSSTSNTKDHSYFLAEEVSKILDLKMLDCLVWINKKKPQKMSSKKERSSVKMAMKYKTLDYDKKLILLVDDMMTTGHTLLAAQRAFQSPNQFYAFVVCCKQIQYNYKIEYDF